MQRIETLGRHYGAFLTLCGTVAGALTFGVMCLVVANAVMRYGFNRPIAGTLELTEGALPFMIFLSLALTQFHGGHIKVVLLTQALSPALARAAKVFAMLLGAVLFAWAAYAGWLMAVKSFAMGELERGSIRFPIWPVKFAVFFGLMLLSIQFFLDAIYCALGGNLDEPSQEVTP
ncbi:TRAP transporter small permease subunit [Actibacterium lipolyticum]|uniref:TRAP transporter small permease protein n=1 Tax=Actibacterium lipolyticum TaxID=1524263 RepID=A0A238JQ96_9RHOB|nr:TRAP transporter small permease subunit [Actibacterium lipolyticum]SMX32840.1 Tripartite ATP-independent periplasmic transporters, DctQ component [Actibacterium lipolyticum]